MKINYLSNAGVILATEEKKITIDLFCDAGDLPYTSTPSEIKEAVIYRKEPYENINYMFYTHRHIDHFHAQSVEEYLNNGGKAQIILPSQAAMQLNEKYIKVFQEQIKIIDIKKHDKITFKVNGASITAFSFIHEGKGNEKEEDIGYLVDLDNKKVLHLGDAGITHLNYCNYNFAKENIDLLIVPFPYITRTDGINMIERYIRPKKVAVVHLPIRIKDVCGWIKATEKCADKAKDILEDIIIFTEVNQEILL